jgi:hypothetical protein
VAQGRWKSARSIALIVITVLAGALAGIAQGAVPAGAAVVVGDGVTDLDVTVDGSDRLVAAWMEVVQEPFERQLHIARTQAGSATLDPTFGTGGKRTVALELPSGFGYGATPGLAPDVEAVGFDQTGAIVLVWFGTPKPDACYSSVDQTFDNCLHSQDRMVIDRYSVAGTRLSRSPQIVPPANTWCSGTFYASDNGCYGDQDSPVITPYITVLDNGAVAVRTRAALTTTPGVNAVKFYSSTTGASLVTVDLGSRLTSYVWAKGDAGAVLTAGLGTADNAQFTIGNWSTVTSTSLSTFCQVTGTATSLVTVRSCFGGSPGTATITRITEAGATDWERTIPYFASPTHDGGGSAALKVEAGDDLLLRFTGTGTIQSKALGGDGLATYTAPVALAGTKAGVGRITSDGSSVELFVENLGGATPATVPAKPAKPGAVPGPSKVTVSWTAPSDGGSPITGYRITPYKAGVAQTPIDVAVLTSKDITALTNGTAYRFTVAARNAIGLGPASDLSESVTPATVPGAPTNVKATAGKNNATVTWSPPASNGGSPILGYTIEVIDDGVSLQNYPVGNVSSFVVPDLFRGNIYTFRVVAVNAIGAGPPSTPSAGIKLPPIAFDTWPAATNRQFVDLLGRAPTAAETKSWVDPLQAGQKPLGDLPAALRTSSDHTGNVDPVTRLYAAYLGRIPDKGGLTYWIGKKRRGTALSTISSNFAGSSEFKTKYGSLTNRAFVELVYQSVLGRPGEASGITYWTAKLDAKTRTRGQVMVGFSESNEYQRKQANRVTVIVLYTFMLGRAPTTGELDTAVATLDGGGTVAALAQQIIDSQPYITRIAGLS